MNRLSLNNSTNGNEVNSATSKESMPMGNAGSVAKEVVFIDTGVENFQTLVDSFDDNAEIVLLDANQDGLTQMAAWAEGKTGYDAIHVLSHGAEGTVQLGAMTLTSDTVAARAADLATLGGALNDTGDIMLYGCRVGADGDGQAFLADLAAATGADIAASDDPTGTSSLGGDWDLEVSNGTIETSSMAVDTFTGVLDLTGAEVSVWYNGSRDGNWVEIGDNVEIPNGFGYVTIDVSPSNSLSITLPEDQFLNVTIEIRFQNGTFTGIENPQITSITGDGTQFLTVSADGSKLVVNGGTGFTTATAWGNTSGPATAFISFSPVGGNDAPTLDLNGGNVGADNAVTFTEFSHQGAANGDGVLIASNATLTDSDGTVDTITVSLTNSQSDTGERVYLSGTFTGVNYTLNNDNTITITRNGGTTDNMLAALQAVRYQNNSDTPATTARTITITATDDTGDNTPQTTTVTVQASNDTPTMTGLPTDVTVAEDTASDLDLSAISLGDPDVTNTLTVTLTAGAGTLSATSGGGVTVGTSGTGVLTLTGTAAAIDTFLNTASNIKYTGAANANGNNATTIFVKMNDGAGSGDIPVGTVNVDITAVNDAPVFGNLDGTPTVTERGSAVQLDADVTISDAELDGANFNGATLTITRNGGADAAANTGQLAALTESGALVFNGATVGTVTTNSGGTLVLTFNASASGAVVNGVLQGVTYTNTSNNPPASAQLNWTFSDNNTGAQGTGGAKTASGSTTVSITGVNDAPTVTPDANQPTAGFTEGGSAVTLFDLDSIDALESGQQIKSFTFTFTGASDGLDEYISIDGPDFALNSTGGLVSGHTVSISGGTVTVTFDTPLSGAGAVSFINGVQYKNTSENPTEGNRVFTLTSVTDDGGTDHGGTDTVNPNLVRTVTVGAVNDAPVIGNLSGDTQTFSIGGSAVTIDTGTAVTVTDVDSASLASASVQITGNFTSGEDVLAFVNDGATMGNIAASYDTGTLTLASVGGTATTAQWAAALAAVTYRNTNTDVGTVNSADRTVTVGVNDGTAWSNAVTTTVKLVAAPVIDLDGDDSTGGTNGGLNAAFTEGDGPVSIVDTDATLSDDGANVGLLTITLTNAQDGDVITLAGRASGDTVNGIVIIYQGDSQILLIGSAPKADYLALMKEARFNNTSEAPNTTTRTITFEGRDTDSNAGPAVTANVTVASINDAPSISGGLIDTTNTEGQSSYIFAGGAVTGISDADAQNGFPNARVVVDIDSSGANPYLTGDQLSIVTQGRVAYSVVGTAGELRYDGVKIADVAWDADNGIMAIQFTNNASITGAVVTDVMNHIVFETSNDDPTQNDTMPDRTINVTFEDGGNTGTGTPTWPIKTGTITITDVNDAPTIALNNGPSVRAGNTVTLSDSHLNEGDPDDDGDQLTYTLDSLPSSGTLLLGGVALGVNDTFTQQDINDGLLSFRAGSTTGDISFDVTLADGGEDGAGTVSDTVTITVQARPTTPTTPSQTIDGAQGTIVREQDPDTGNTITRITVESSTGGRNDINPITPDVDIMLGNSGMRASISEDLSLNASYQTGTIQDARTLISVNGTRAGTRETNDFLNTMNDNNPLNIATIVPTGSNTSSDGEQRLLVELGGSNSLAIVDASNLSEDRTITINGSGNIVVRGEGRFRGNDDELSEGSEQDVDNVLGDDSDQILFFGPGNDIIRGGGGDDYVGSAGGDDLLFGNDGNDTLEGGDGNNSMHGGRGHDVITLDGKREDYLITQKHGVITIERSDSSSTDTVINAESLVFSDQTLDITYDSKLSWVATLYDRLLDRQGDLDGFQYWADQLVITDNFIDITWGFLYSEEFSGRQSQSIDQLNKGEQVDLLYQTLLQREPDTEGHTYWVGVLESGVSLSGIAASIALSAEGASQLLDAESWDFIL